MLDLSKAIITVDTSPETLAAFERRCRYANATDAERRRMADEEQKAWNKKYLKGILMPGEKPTLLFHIRRAYFRVKEKLSYSRYY